MSNVVERAMCRTRRYTGGCDRAVIDGVVQALPSIEGGRELVRRIGRAKSDAEFDDYLAEAWFVAVFLYCGYSVTIYPDGDVGPDLLIANGTGAIYVEVARFRPMNVGPQQYKDGTDCDLLPEYGDITRDTRKVLKKIHSKLRQLGERFAAVAIWNDDGALEDLEFRAAVHQLRDNGEVPPGLEIAIYGSPWVGCGASVGNARQFVAIPIKDQLPPWAAALACQLSRATWGIAVGAFTERAR